MKNAYKLSIALFLSLLFAGSAFSQNPTYNLRAMNLKYYGCPANTLEFDIYMEHTNPPTDFIYAAGEYFFDFNPLIANGGTLTYQIVNSDLPSNMLPRNPTVSGSQLRLASNQFPGPLNGYSMTNNGFPGTRIVRMRLSTSAASFAAVPLNLNWSIQAQGNFYTIIFAYVGGTATNITTDVTHMLQVSSSLTCEKFLLSRPLYNSPTNPLPITFSWGRALNAIYYRLQVSTDHNFSSYVFNDSGIVDTFKTISGLAQSTRYFWRVSAWNSTNYYATTDTWYFNTGFPNNSQTPTYNLTARNFIFTNPNDNQIEFDIYIEHTNPPSTFEYAVGEYFFDFNPLIANGGTLTYEIVGSDLPLNMQPRNPLANGSILYLAANNSPGAGFGYNMTNNGFPGTKIVRMRLTTSAPHFAYEPLNLAWRNSSSGVPYTAIFSYVGLTTTDITTPATHSVEYNGPLPVELSSFTANANKNNITLNWSTANESNNSGFDLERKDAGRKTQEEWLKVTFIKGNGTAASQNNYEFADRGLNAGIYNYRLKQIDYNGNYKYYDLQNEINVGVPAEFSLSQNYPNPFNPSTKIDFDLPYDGNVKIILYDISGRETATLINEFKSAGYYTIRFNGSNLSSGIYFYRLVAGKNIFSKSMMILK